MNRIKRIIVNSVGSSYIFPNSVRKKIYAAMGLDVKKAKEIRSRCFFNSEHTTFGKGVFVNMNTQFHSGYSKDSRIDIGDDTYIGMNVNFCAITHEIGNSDKRAGKDLNIGITIGSGAWIGANSVVMPGTNIGNGCIIAAGSVVSKDCAPNGLYAGVPARRIKDLV